LHRHLLEIVAMVLGEFWRINVPAPAHDEARRKLLGPMVEQHEASRACRRGRRALRDIDPDTGEPDSGDIAGVAEVSGRDDSKGSESALAARLPGLAAQRSSISAISGK
jgi:hypothetical protein